MNTHHRINYIEMSAPDLAAVKDFYSKAFGWEFTDYGPDYLAFTDGNLDGGFARQPVVAGGPLVILFSDDLAASEAAVISGGGVITRPAYEFPGGRRFHFTDPAGNELAIWALS